MLSRRPNGLRLTLAADRRRIPVPPPNTHRTRTLTIPEIPLRETKYGLVADGDGWFVINARESRWRDAGHFDHMIVGAGSGPSVVLAVGARGGRKGLVYAVEPLAIKHGAGVEREVTKPEEAYAGFRAWARCRYREGWLPDL
jgi:hypothetical protein